MTSTTASTIVFVDSTVDDYQSLVSSALPGTEVVVLDATQDGIAQITSALAGRSGVESLQILSHGSSGQLQLGSTQLGLETLSDYTAQIQSWSGALTETADILLYGCNVAAGDIGNQFIQQFATFTDADVAASTNLTGNVALGGDWDLEAAVGQIETSLQLDQAILEGYDSTLAVLFREDFTDTDVVSRPWLFGRGVTTSNNPFLTARGTVAPSEGGLPGTTNPIDAPGQGALRLTNAQTNQATFAIYNQVIPSNAGLSITFDLFSYGGSGADGVSFFLIDGRQSPRVAGGFGGSLGYAPRDVPLDVNGLVGGYVGIGFDEFGNFSAGTEGRTGGPGRRRNAVAIRGSQANNYEYLTGNSSLPGRIDNPSATRREDARRRVNIELDQSGLINVRMDFNRDNDFNDPGELVIDSFNVVEANGSPLPATFKFGFASSTGNSTNIHEIRTFLIETTSDVDPNLPPIAANRRIEVGVGDITPITSVVARDSDGTIASYTVRTIPPSAQGTLFLGDPNAGGRAITVGQRIAPGQIRQLFFRATNQFSGATFTFDATDDDGAVSESPGTVSLVLAPGSGPDPDNNPPVVANRTFEVEPETTLRLVRGLAGTDSDGEITFYRVSRLPEADQGVLFLGNPAAGGRALAAGQGIRPDQVGELYFQANEDFTGTSFIYVALDDDGARSVTPATVTLNSTDRLPPGSGNCGPGVTLTGDEEDNTLTGGDDSDTISGAGGNDTLRGLGCDDQLNGGDGDDLLFGDDGNDVLVGGDGRDILRGGAGDDFLRGGLGIDVLRGGNGDDLLYGGGGDDNINGEGGNDLIRGGSGNDRIRGGEGNDRISGGTGDDLIDGGNGDDVLRGSDGDDVVRGRSGNDRISGGAGNDRIDGGVRDDRIRGGEGNDVLIGGDGSDVLIGGSGNDYMFGGTGPDELLGQQGRDLFVYRSYDDRGDTILDFTIGEDRIDLSRVFRDPAYSLEGEAAYRSYVTLFQQGSDTIVKIRLDGDVTAQSRYFIALQNITATSLSFSDFVV
jgi:Ca2+-binding RTX toxin-like protein